MSAADLALFDLDNTLLAGDSDYEWGQFLIDRGVLDRDAYEVRNTAFFEQYKAGTLDIHAYLQFALEPLARHTPEEADCDVMLDLLEELLLEFSGTLLVVSHDRAFLDNVVTSTLVFEGNGRVGEYVGGYADWVRQRAAVSAAGIPSNRAAAPASASAPAPAKDTAKPAAKPAKPRRLTFKEKTELAALPDAIDALERERGELFARLADPTFLRDGAAVIGVRARLTALEAELTATTARWEALELIAAEG